MIKLLVMPQATNPYQSLLYSPLVNQSDRLEVTFSKDSPWLFCSYPWLLIKARLSGTRLLHLHWLYWLTVPLPSQKLRQLASRCNIWLFFGLARLLGFKLIWTAHNITPHEPQTSNDLAVARSLSKQATQIIVHSSFVIEQMAEKGLNTTHTTVIPHGNYIGSYPNTISQATARTKLHINKDEVVILFFGLIRPYKGIEDLLQAFQELVAKNKKLRLVIAGACGDEQLKQTITQAAQQHTIDFYEGFVADDDVQLYFNACDMVCLPFRAITTSGSALLALSFGKPIIAPLAGALTDFPSESGYYYNPKASNGLSQALNQACNEQASLSDKGKIALEYAQALNWDDIASKTYKVYQEALEHA